MSNAKKRCKHCKDFKPTDSLIKINAGHFCDINHAMLWGKEKAQALAVKNAVKAKKVARKQHKADKERIKPRATWLKEAQTAFNKYVRLRDIDKGCCSCDKSKDWQGQWHCSHLYSRGHSSSLRFNLWNCNKSCSVCNNHLSGNIGVYTPMLIEKIGQERMDYLYANKNTPTKYDIEYLERLKRIFNKRARILTKRLDNE